MAKKRAGFRRTQIEFKYENESYNSELGPLMHLRTSSRLILSVEFCTWRYNQNWLGFHSRDAQFQKN
jgi:hypothetical protein